LHALLLFAVLRHAARPAAEQPGPAMLWLKLGPPVLAARAAPPMVVAQRRVQRLRKAPAEPARAVPPPAVKEMPLVAEAAPVASRTATILSIAKRDLGKIDRDLRDEFKQPRLSASVETALQRLARGIEQAHDAAPNKWYQAARIEDITPPGDDARKIYRITTALGSYCVRYPDKNKPGFDHGQANLGDPLIGACPHTF
jgi:hypothetical protein